MGKTSATVASGISCALSSVDGKKKSVKPSEKELRKTLRRNVDRSKNLLVSLEQNLSSWDYEEHNATMSSFWSSTTAVHASVLQEALNRGNDAGVRHQMNMGSMRDAFTRAEEQLRLSSRRLTDPAIPNIKDKVKNISSVAKLIKGLVDMTLQTALNTSKLAGSVADGWSVPAQFESSKMRALEDLACSRRRNGIVSVMLSRERGSISFGDSRSKTNVLVIPLVILEHLVANKVVLDRYCSASGMSLSKQLDHFIHILSGKND
ncbi:hypothetical protein O3P69_002253 [Scylla paramamosain]|uniref:Uncharacterized protein n=1 Tax=Scylla paramamosain TaxID=85552 RepID=A0AAW0V5G7_SCYPA